MISNAFSLIHRRIHPCASRVLNLGMVIGMQVKQSSNYPNMPTRFSSGADENQLTTETNALLERRWTLDEDKMGVQKTFNFPTFAKALVTHSSGQPRLP